MLESELCSGRPLLIAAERECLCRLLLYVGTPIPSLYDMPGIQSANQLWTSTHVPYYLGSPSEIYMPGNVDPNLTLIFGHAEPDSPIALDYRTQPPRVVYLGGVDQKSFWLELAPTYETFRAKFRK
jgi:hypothetical protein